MSTTTPAQPETPQPQRVKKRIYIPLILLVLLIVIAVVFYVRGTWADTTEHNPSGPDAGTITQLLQRPNGNVVVRCVVIVDAPPKDVWAVINDYASHKDFLPYVTKVEATPQKDGKILIDGVAYSRLWQEWPFQSLVTNKENPDDGEYSALWSEEDKGEFKVNRGGWSLKPHKSKKQTQLEFTLQIELQKYPSFLVRDIIMDRLHSVLKAMRDETLRRREKNKA
jgi:ribosome-associated toxin RatA of RatAB toxin-antitoxin module